MAVQFSFSILIFFISFQFLIAGDFIPQKNIFKGYPPNKTFHDNPHCRITVWNSDQPNLQYSLFLNGCLELQSRLSVSVSGKNLGYAWSDLPHKARETHQNEHLFKEQGDCGYFSGPSRRTASCTVMWRWAHVTWLWELHHLQEWVNGSSQDCINGAHKMAYDYVK